MVLGDRQGQKEGFVVHHLGALDRRNFLPCFTGQEIMWYIAPL